MRGTLPGSAVIVHAARVIASQSPWPAAPAHHPFLGKTLSLSGLLQ
jgi:hypothetical protein